MQKISRTKTAGRIRQLLREKGITARKVQEALELESTQAVYRWTHGHTLPSLENAVMLCQLLELPLEELLVLENGESTSRRILRMNLENNSSLVEIVGTKQPGLRAVRLEYLLSYLDSFPRDVSACGI